jgi:hypothetical protein
VTVQPGGGISSLFPGPGRSIGSVTQSANDISPIFFSAFPDKHLDSLDNPAYATDFKEAQGRLLLLPSVSESYHVKSHDGSSTSEDPPKFNYSVSPQSTFFTPIPGSRFVIGGGVSSLHTKLQEQVDIKSIDYYDDQYNVRRVNALNASVVAAYSFGADGGTSVGIGIDRLAGEQNFSNHHKSAGVNTYLYPEPTRYDHRNSGDSDAHFSNTHLTLGITRRLPERSKIGLYYRHGFNSSNQRVFQEQQRYFEGRPDDSYYVAGSANISAFSSSSEAGIRLRGSLTRRLFYGAEGSYLYDRVRIRRQKSDQPAVNHRYLARRARVGMGLGFLLTSKVLLNLDVAGGLYNTGKPVDEPIISGLNSMSFSALTQISPRTIRGTSVSVHGAVQANPWRNLILSYSILTTIRGDTYADSYNGVTFAHTYKYKVGATGLGIGWKLKPNVIAEYLISQGYGDRVPSHAIRLRYTFNLGITNEK